MDTVYRSLIENGYYVFKQAIQPDVLRSALAVCCKAEVCYLPKAHTRRPTARMESC
jgi:hypothetical protein